MGGKRPCRPLSLIQPIDFNITTLIQADEIIIEFDVSLVNNMTFSFGLNECRLLSFIDGFHVQWNEIGFGRELFLDAFPELFVINDFTAGNKSGQCHDIGGSDAADTVRDVIDWNDEFIHIGSSAADGYQRAVD